MNILVLMTQNVSLKEWNKKKILSRELLIYKKLSQKVDKYFFFTWGNSTDKKYLPKGCNFELISLFNKTRNISNFLTFIYSILFIFLNSSKFRSIDLVKSNQLIGAHIGLVLKIFFKKKFICRLGYEPNLFISKKSFLFKRYLLRIYSFLIYKAADKIIVTSQSSKNYIVNNFFIKNKKIEIIPNYVDTKIFTKIKKETKSFKKFITISRLTSQKNLEYLFNEISMANVSLDIIGPKKNIRYYKKIAIKNNARVKFLGSVNNISLKNKLKKYDFFILTSKFEGNPKSLLEAMSLGMPIIASNVLGINNIIKDCKNGFLINLNKGSLSKKLSEVVKKRNIESVKNNARKYIIENHSINKIARLEFFLYKSTLKNF